MAKKPAAAAADTPAPKNDVVPASENKGALAIHDGDIFGEMAGMGLENVGANDILVPRLTILQSNSPQLMPTKAEFIKGAAMGMICDTGLGEVYPQGLIFLPCFYRKDWIEWYPRNSNKGIAKVHATSDILTETRLDEKRRPVLPNGNYVAETPQFFGFNVTSSFRPCFIAMPSTQIKKAKKINSLASSEKLRRGDGSEYTAPLFYRTYNLGTGPESNAEGDWYGWTVERGASLMEVCQELGNNPAQIVKMAFDFAKDIAAGSRQGDLSGMTGEATAQGGGSSDDRM